MKVELSKTELSLLCEALRAHEDHCTDSIEFWTKARDKERDKWKVMARQMIQSKIKANEAGHKLWMKLIDLVMK